jgi:hypothetical protein
MLLILFGSLTGPAQAADVPLPPNLRIAAPDSSIPPEIAGFSGKWAGEWSGGGVGAGYPHVLVVLKIDPADANGQLKGSGMERVLATVRRLPRLELSEGSK